MRDRERGDAALGARHPVQAPRWRKSVEELLPEEPFPLADEVPAERFQVLRNGARQLRVSRYKLAACMTVVLISLMGAGSVFARVVQGPPPKLSAAPKPYPAAFPTARPST